MTDGPSASPSKYTDEYADCCTLSVHGVCFFWGPCLFFMQRLELRNADISASDSPNPATSMDEAVED